MEVTTKFRRVVIAVFVMVNSCVALFPGDGRAGGRRAGGGASGSGELSATN
jgi:hypothetical protein